MGRPLRVGPKALREASALRLRGLGLRVPEHLPLIERGLVLRPRTQIAQRANVLSLFYGMYLGGTGVIAELGRAAEEYGFARHLTRRERAFVAAPDSASSNDLVQFSWRKESARALLWVGGIANEDLSADFAECDFAAYWSRVPPERSMESYLRAFRLRERADVLAMLDLHYCLHWCCRNESQRMKGASVEIHPSVVIERRRALEWATHRGSWDEVSLDT